MSESKCPFCNMTETFRACLEGAESMKVRRAAEFVGQPATYRVMLTRFQEILVCAEHAVGIQRPKHPAPQADANDVPCDGSRFAPDTSLQRCQLPHGHSGPHQYHPTPQAEHTPEPEAPRAFYACTSCNREENCHVAEEMYWSVSEAKWVCEICWDEKEEALGVRLSDHLKAQPRCGIADPSAVKEAIEALERIAKWFGEFPETGRFWDEPKNKQPMSYAACFGSNGERDFMRELATAALANLVGKA